MGKLTAAARCPSILMKPFIPTPERIPAWARPNGPACAVLIASLLCALMPWAVQAQSADSLQPQNPAAKPMAVATPDVADSFLKMPSRRVGPEEFSGYVQAISSVLSIRSRETDPFGRVQDPDAKPIIKPTIASTKRVAPMQATPFSDIVRLIKVTTIMPGERRFLIGNRSVKQGDRIPLAFRGKNIPVEVASVSSNRIQFRNLENGETAELSLNMLPPGMKPGNDGVHAPGMMADNPDAPIDLDGNTLPLNSAQIR
jgi:hypothetical protein